MQPHIFYFEKIKENGEAKNLTFVLLTRRTRTEGKEEKLQATISI